MNITEFLRSGVRALTNRAHPGMYGKLRYALGTGDVGNAIGIPVAYRDDHMLVLGATRQGKSTLVADMTAQMTNQSVMVIDPHRSTVDYLLSRNLPDKYEPESIFLLCPGKKFVPGLNLLQVLPGETAYDTAQRFTEVCVDIFFGGDITEARRFQDTTLHTTWALAATGWTVVEIERFLTSDAFRSVLYDRLNEFPDLQRWIMRFNGLNRVQRQTQIESTINRLAFFQHGEPALLFGQRESTIDIQKFLSLDQAVFFAPLSPDLLHETGAYVVAGVLLSLVDTLLAKRRKNTMHPRLRIVVEEFQRYPVPSLIRLLTERRGFGASVTLVTQGLQLLSRSMRSTILNNVGPIIAFRVSADEAQTIAPEIFRPHPHTIRRVLNSGEKEFYTYSEMMAYAAHAVTQLPHEHFFYICLSTRSNGG